MKISVFRKGNSLDLSRGLHYQANFSLFQQEREEAFLVCGPRLPPKSFRHTGNECALECSDCRQQSSTQKAQLAHFGEHAWAPQLLNYSASHVFYRM